VAGEVRARLEVSVVGSIMLGLSMHGEAENSMKRIHIVGCGPRSGTTLMVEMLIACFDIDLYTDHEDSIYRLPSRDAVVYLTKKPTDIMMVEPALRITSNLYVIYMLRDPRDMIVSRHGQTPDVYWSGLVFWKNYTPYGRRLQHHPRFITIRYEDLVTRPDEIQRELMARIPFLVKRADFSDYHLRSTPSSRALDALRGVRAISSEGIGSWRRHLPRIAGQLRIHGSISDDLIEYGYEQDDSWLRELEGVQPDLSPSRWKEQISYSRLLRLRIKRYLLAPIVLLGHLPVTGALLRSLFKLVMRGRDKRWGRS